MIRKGVILPLMVMCVATVMAHEYWVCLEEYSGRMEMKICSGHSFPESELLLAERLLADVGFMKPNGEFIPVKPTAAGQCWRAEATADSPGVWAADFALKRPQEDEAFFRGRCLRVIGGVDDQARYARGKGLEIVPQAPLSQLKPGGALVVALHWEGAPVDGKITVIPQHGSVMFFSTGRQRPAEVKLPKGGLYLLTASHRGKSFALTITIPEGTAEGP